MLGVPAVNVNHSGAGSNRSLCPRLTALGARGGLVWRESVRHLAAEHAAVSEPHKVITADRLAGEQARQNQVEDRLLREHLAGREAEQWHVVDVGQPEETARVDRHAVLDDPGADLAKRAEERL